MKTLSKNSRIIHINGNLFDYAPSYIKQGNNGSSVIIPHVCNNIDAFGAGFAAAVTKHYPVAKENYHLLGLNFLKKNLGYVQFVEVAKDPHYGHKLIIANMIAQNGIINNKNPRPLNYFSLCKSMNLVKQYIQSNFGVENKVQIHTPKFGCGLAGGDWKFIYNLIEDIWTNLEIFIYNYQLKS